MSAGGKPFVATIASVEVLTQLPTVAKFKQKLAASRIKPDTTVGIDDSHKGNFLASAGTRLAPATLKWETHQSAGCA